MNRLNSCIVCIAIFLAGCGPQDESKLEGPTEVAESAIAKSALQTQFDPTIKYVECLDGADSYRVFLDGYTSPMAGRPKKSVMIHASWGFEQLYDTATASKDAVTEVSFRNPYLYGQSEKTFSIVTKDWKTGFYRAFTGSFCYPGPNGGCPAGVFTMPCTFVR